MFNYLVDHAIKLTWCTPDQDKQVIIKPAKLTPINGVWNKFQLMGNTIYLPVQGKRFNIYQIGQIHPNLMGLFASLNAWENFSDICNRENLIADIYNDKGIQMPRFSTWYRLTSDKNLIVAVQEQPGIPFDFNNDNLYIRLYSNAYFSSIESDPLVDYIYTAGKVILNTNEILNIQNDIITYSAKPGKVYCFINGIGVENINLLNTVPGDAVEFVYDSSIFSVVDLPVSSLYNFNSELDHKGKYLIHFTNSDANVSKIEYHDDIDFFLLKKETNNKFKSIYYHRNHTDSVRQVTHRDYSVPVQTIATFAQGQVGWTDPEQLTLRLHLRKSGYNRPLVNENNRIKELYKLPDAQIIQAMVGVNAVNPNWTASNLENSAYVEVMGSKLTDITLKKVEDAYGYNAISTLLGDTPRKTRLENSRQRIEVPYGLTANATMYEYDADGVLIDYHYSAHCYVYSTASDDARMVEMISGEGGVSLDDTYGLQSMLIDPAYNYRMYKCPIILGTPTNQWEDVTGTGDYSLTNNVLTWLTNPAEYYTLVRSNKKFLAYSILTTPLDGVIRFSLDQDMFRNGTTSTWVMQIPLGELDLFLNNKSLIKNVDYFINFPEIVIVNKKYLTANPSSTNQRVTIRFTGFCDSDLKMNFAEDTGFIDHQLLSNNHQFNIRDDRVLRIVVDGKVKHRSDLLFKESNNIGSAWSPSNGSPYSIRDIVVPLNSNAETDTYTLRSLSKVIDTRVSNYLKSKLPDPQPTTPNVIPEKYQIFSPFCCKLIYDIIRGDLTDARINSFCPNDVVIDICKNYEYLLKYDPCMDENLPDLNFVELHPHNLNTVIGLTQFQYVFLNKAIALYLKDRVNLSGFVQIIS